MPASLPPPKDLAYFQIERQSYTAVVDAILGDIFNGLLAVCDIYATYNVAGDHPLTSLRLPRKLAIAGEPVQFTSLEPAAQAARAHTR